MIKINESLLVNIELSDEASIVEVVRYHGYMREVVNVFEGDRAKALGMTLANRTTPFSYADLKDVMHTLRSDEEGTDE